MDNEKSPKWLIYVAIALFLGFSLAVFLAADNWRLGFLGFSSGLFGFILKYSGFGFTGAFRVMVTNGDFQNFRNMLVMLFSGTGMCSLVEAIKGLYPLFDPTKSKPFSDSAQEVGVSVLIGSFIFGIGMILGSGCASGTFVGLGEGFVKSYIVLPCFIAGATIAATNPLFNWWSKLPKSKTPIQFEFGFTLLILMGLYALTFLGDWIKAKVKSDGTKDDFISMRQLFSMDNQSGTSNNQNKSGWYKATAFAALNGVVLSLYYLCTGSMIGVTGVFPRIGALIIKIFGAHPEKWDYFGGNLPTNVFNLIVFDSNIFMGLGAFLASSIKGNFGKVQKNGILEFTKGIIGGFLMGIGARMAGGCNIGSMTSGITSSSLSGFVWMFSAILGALITCHTVNFLESKCKREKTVNTFTPIV
jgi:uncharacterized membrane protein YedE/YeeE